MPTGGDGGEYRKIAQIYTNYDALSSNSFQYNISASLSGYYSRESMGLQNSDGEWHSSAFVSEGGMYRLYVTSTNVRPDGFNSLNRYIGRSVRCLVGK